MWPVVLGILVEFQGLRFLPAQGASKNLLQWSIRDFYGYIAGLNRAIRSFMFGSYNSQEFLDSLVNFAAIYHYYKFDINKINAWLFLYAKHISSKKLFSLISMNILTISISYFIIFHIICHFFMPAFSITFSVSAFLFKNIILSRTFLHKANFFDSNIL